MNLVLLHVSVLNERGVFVPGLTQDSFKVFEDKVEQKLAVFKQEDVPVSVGLVIDNSGSMRDKRPEVNTAALTFVKTSNPQDEAFVVNFNDDYYLDTEHDFTSDINEMKAALERIDARGSTALYDAIIGSLDHLKKGHKDKKVLLVVTDGEDNASRHHLEDVIEEAQKIGRADLRDRPLQQRGLSRGSQRDEQSQARAATTGAGHRRARLLPRRSGRHRSHLHANRARHPQPVHLAYYPTNTAQDGTYRSVQVDVVPPRGAGKLTVRTRTGYYARRAPSTGD